MLAHSLGGGRGGAIASAPSPRDVEAALGGTGIAWAGIKDGTVFLASIAACVQHIGPPLAAAHVRRVRIFVLCTFSFSVVA
jgi:hypothetical protein